MDSRAAQGADVAVGRRGEGEEGGKHPTRSKSPSTYPPLLFIVPNFHSLRTRRAVHRALARDPEKRRTALADGHTGGGIRFVRWGERHRFFSLGLYVCWRRPLGKVAIRRGSVLILWGISCRDGGFRVRVYA